MPLSSLISPAFNAVFRQLSRLRDGLLCHLAYKVHIFLAYLRFFYYLCSRKTAAYDTETDKHTLSACNTALGEVTTEGVWGLQRAFKQAGAQTIVMSLWQVDDEATAIFMQYFYEALLKGRQTLAKAVSIDTEIAEHIFDYPHSALATAQRRMRQHPKYSKPYYWAGFIMLD